MASIRLWQTVSIAALWYAGTGAAQSLPRGLESHFPAANATGIARNIRIAFHFAANTAVGTGQLTMRPANGSSLTPWSAFIDYGQQGIDVVCQPTAALAASSSYTVAWNSPTASYQFTFTTGTDLDSTAPRLISVQPDPIAATVDPTGPYVFQFDKPVDPRVRAEVSDSGSNPLTYFTRLSADRRSVEVHATLALRIPAAVQVRLDPETIFDMAGNAFKGTSVSVRFITTYGKDFRGPRLIGQYPEPGTTAVPTNSVIQLLFDHPMNAYALRQGLILESAGQAIPIEPYLAGPTIIIGGVSLAPNTTYRVTATASLIDDYGFSAEPAAWQFSTGAFSPPVSSRAVVAPAGLSTNTPLNTRVIVRSALPLPSFAPLLVDPLLRTTLPDYLRLLGTATLTDDSHTLAVSFRDPLPAWSDLKFQIPGLRDITGGILVDSFTFRTSGSRDEDAPHVLASTPSDQDASVPVSTGIVIVFDEPVGLMTPSDGVRLIKDGQRVEGSATIYQSAISFKPVRALDPLSSYVFEAEGVSDVSGNIMPRWSVTFQTTAAGVAPPTGTFLLLRSSLDDGDPDPNGTLEFQYNRPLSPGFTSVTANVVVTRLFNSPLYFPQSIRSEISGSTLRITSPLPWASGRNTLLAVSAADVFGSNTSATITFRARASGDTTRPEIVAITPPSGASIRVGDPIEILFSKPMLTASQEGGALAVTQSEFNALASSAWSDDHRKLTITTRLLTTADGPLTTPIVVVASSGMTDLAGNPLNTVVARFPLATSRFIVQRLPSLVSSFPAGGVLDLRAPLTLIFSLPVDAAVFNRAVWVFTSSGRAAGTWETTADGIAAIFRPQSPWPASDSIRLFLAEPVIENLYLGKPTAAAPAPGLVVLRTSLSNGLPANAVIEVEFNQELPSGPALVVASIQGVPLAVDESRPRPRVLRLTPRSPLPTSGYLDLSAQMGSGLTWFNGSPFSAGGSLMAPLPLSGLDLLYRAPAPGSEGIPQSARISSLFAVPLNPLTITESSVRVMGGGRPLLVSVSNGSAGPKLVPLELLPANQTIEVQMSGLEDRLGRPLPPASWIFHTGTGVDFERPRLIYSNAPAGGNSPGFDPLAPAVMEFDEALDPASTTGISAVDATFTSVLSSDLRTLRVIPKTFWNRGLPMNLRGDVCDLSGNCTSTIWSNPGVGFDSQPPPVNLYALSLRDGQTGVPINVQFALLFDRPVASDTLRTVRVLRGGERIALSTPSITADGRIAFTADAKLDPNTEYQWIVEGVQDSSGNTLAAPRTIGFTTGEELDVTNPTATIRYTTPSAPIRVRFSETLDQTTVLTLSNPLTYNDVHGRSFIVPVSIDWSEDRLELTVTPRTPLQVGTDFKLDLGGVADLAGRRLADGFTIRAVENPTLSAVQLLPNPPDGSVNVPINLTPSVYFSRSVQTPVIRLTEDGKPLLTAASTLNSLVSLQKALKPATQYRIEVSGFQDEYENDIPPRIFTFSTGSSSDFTGLQFVSSTPETFEAGVAPDTAWQISFNRRLFPRVLIGAARLTASRAIPFRYSAETSAEKLILRPSPAWPAAASIQLILFPSDYFGPPWITDWAGNLMRIQTILNFRTAAINDPDPPLLESVSPPAGTTIPGAQATIELRFSKPVMTPTDALQVYYGATLTAGFGQVSQDLRTITYNLQPPPNSRVTVIGTSGIRDNADNPLAPFVLEFPTGENAASGNPTAQLIEPKTYPNPPPESTVLIRFDRVMDSSSVLTAFRITQNGANMAGAISVLEGGRAYRFTPATPFMAGAIVNVFVLPSAMDPDGRNVLQGLSSLARFSIAAAPGALTILERGFGSEAPADAILEVAFDRPLDRSSVDTDSVWLRRGSRLISGYAELREDRILQFTPDAPLEPGAEYVLTAGAALRALDGSAFAGQDMRFHAAASAEAGEIESVENVSSGGRAAVRVRFTRPVSPLAARSLHLEFEGRVVELTALRSTDSREFWLLPSDASGPRSFTMVLDGVPARNGRRLADRRIPVASRSDVPIR